MDNAVFQGVKSVNRTVNIILLQDLANRGKKGKYAAMLDSS
jgi:hypothetical protein